MVLKFRKLAGTGGADFGVIAAEVIEACSPLFSRTL